jgi:hypothetical protein
MGLCLSHHPLACRTSESWEKVSITFSIDLFKESLSREFKFCVCWMKISSPPLNAILKLNLEIFSLYQKTKGAPGSVELFKFYGSHIEHFLMWFILNEVRGSIIYQCRNYEWLYTVCIICNATGMPIGVGLYQCLLNKIKSCLNYCFFLQCT